jgi:hypothetical protein
MRDPLCCPAESKPFLVQRDILVLFLLAVLCRLALWGMGAMLVPPSSDESITMLLAQEISRGKFPLLFMGQPYLFPIESYLSVLWSHLPPVGAAARVTCLLLGFASTWVALHLLPREGGNFSRRLGGLLAVFPSFYILILQGFYALPGYSFLMFSCLALPSLALYTVRTDKLHGAFLLGLLSGLSFSAHTLSLCASIPSLLVALSPGRSLRKTGRCCLAVCAGGALGLLPFLLAQVTIPGAHEMATATLPWASIVSRWWSLGPQGALPIAMGLRVLDFPTEAAHPPLYAGFGRDFALFLGIFLGTVLIWRARIHILHAKQGHWPRWEAPDLILAVVLMNITLVAASPRAHFDSCRYLLPAALTLPLLVAILSAQSARPLRVLGSGTAIALLLAQAHTGWTVMKNWRQPDFAVRASIPDLQPTLEGLRHLNLRAVFASYGAAYRLTYESGGAVVASQRKNERFNDWPLPYLAAVTSSPRVAYVLTDAISYLKPALFETHLASAGVSASVMTTGAFRIYYDFVPLHQITSYRLPPDSIHITAPRQEVASRLSDGALDVPWRKPTQQTHDTIVLTWPQTRPLDHLLIHYGVKDDWPRTMDIWRHTQGAWREFAAERTVNPAPFSLEHGYPIYGASMEFVDLRGETADGLELEIHEPRTGRDWNITEIEVYVRRDVSTHDVDARVRTASCNTST